MKPSDGADASRPRNADASRANPPLLPETHNPTASNDETEFSQSLQDIEQSLQALKDRYAQVNRDEPRRDELRSQAESVKQTLRQSPNSGLRAELKQLRQQLDELEVALESRLFSFKPFWQAIRFGGLGLLIGWLLKSCTG